MARLTSKSSQEFTNLLSADLGMKVGILDHSMTEMKASAIKLNIDDHW